MMKKQPDIDAAMEYFSNRGDGHFVADEAAVLNDYAVTNAIRSGIAIKALTLIGAILVTCAFLGFLFIANIFDSGISMNIFGTVLIAGALAVNKYYNKLILDTFSVSFYICGCLLLMIGLFESKFDENLVALIFLFTGLVSLAIVQYYMIAFIASAIIFSSAICLVMISRHFQNLHILSGFFLLLYTYWLLDEARIIKINNKISRLYNPVRLAILFTLLFLVWFVPLRATVLYLSAFYWITGVVALGAVIFLVPKILQALGWSEPQTRWIGLAAAFIIMLPAIWAPGIAISMLVILVSFYVSFITGYIGGIIALIWSVSQFYYNLQFTLLHKSLMMMGTGIFFFLLYFITRKKLEVK